ncbi:MAG: hypothetical protein A3J74_11255 [Elusimicrobia bacterium RIFCSPHIGHO2_02_FULL_57_9]|nr:MAG: hypothetical protein A3J74_11255 [Elusimicrobia bacterium RIFCSPHIGHO2_02_FULL_57_9]
MNAWTAAYPAVYALLGSCDLSAQTINTITLNPATTYQTITGWEAAAQAGQSDPLFPNFKDTLFNQAVNDLGVNRLRLEINSGAENTRDFWTEFRNGQIDNATLRCLRYSTVNDNADPFVINPSGFQFAQLDDTVDNVVLPMMQKLQARGERLYVNLNYVAFTGQMTGAGCPAGLQYNHDDSPDEYAEFVLATYQHLQSKYGWGPDSWEIILEPDNTSFWRGTQIGNAIAAAGSRLQANAFSSPRFVAPSVTNMANASPYFDAMIAVSGVQQYLSEISYHRYGGVSTGNLQSIASRAVQYGLNTGMLEHIAANYLELHDDLKIGRNSAWQQFALAFPTSDNGAQYYWIDAGGGVNIGGRTKFLRQYFKYIRKGAVRIDAVSNNSGFDPLAFINTDGKYVVVVKTSAGGSFSIQGLPAGTYGIKYTAGGADSPAYYDVDSTDRTITAGQAVAASIPIAGAITIYAKSFGPAPDAIPPAKPRGLRIQ